MKFSELKIGDRFREAYHGKHLFEKTSDTEARITELVEVSPTCEVYKCLSEVERDMIFHGMTEKMQAYGGGFVQRLAKTLIHADSHNRRKLLKTFPELVETYGDKRLLED